MSNTVEREGLTLPKRFGSQKAIEVYVSELTDDQFVSFCKVLRSRKWTDQEMEARIYILKPHLDPTDLP